MHTALHSGSRLARARRLAPASLSLLHLLTALAVLAALGPKPAAAQMQIPNPLIRPRSLTHPGTGTELTPAEASRMAQPAMPAASTAPIALNANGTPATTDDPYARNVTELKDRFSNFYVSAIVGKQAVLRRSVAARASSSAALASPAVGTSMAPVSLSTGGGSVQSARSDALMVADGELLDSVGTIGALVAKVSRHQVAIYYVQETMVLPGGKLIGKRVIVFTGELENSGGTSAPLIVLERADGAYKRMITVETKTRSAAGAGTTDASGSNSNTPQNPPLSPAP